jgi:hypothetical protein
MPEPVYPCRVRDLDGREHVVNLPELVKNSRYYVRFRVPGVRRVDQEMVAKLVEMRRSWCLDYPVLVLSLLPFEGTEHLAVAHVLEMRATTDRICVPRDAGEGGH